MNLDDQLKSKLRIETGKQLRTLREDLGLTPEIVHKDCKISIKTLRNIEEGKGNPRILIIIRLLKYYRAIEKKNPDK